jgi:DNA modification methylase
MGGNSEKNVVGRRYPLGETQGVRLKIASPQEFKDSLESVTGLSHAFSASMDSDLELIITKLGPSSTVDVKARSTFWRIVNEKLDSNKTAFAELYRWLAENRSPLNFKEKKLVEMRLNANDVGLASQILQNKFPNLLDVGSKLREMGFLNEQEAKQRLKLELKNPSKLRRLQKRDVSQDISHSLAAYWLWSNWEPSQLFSHFSGIHHETEVDYLEFLRSQNPELFQRKRSLVMRFYQGNGSPQSNHFELGDWIRSEWLKMDNHGFLILSVEVEQRQAAEAWDIVEKTKLFAERFHEKPLENMFFRHKEIRQESEDFYGEAVPLGEWQLASEGFTYRDTFVIKDQAGEIVRLVAVFQKNLRDETLLNCPGCRSTKVQGDSYPTLGVKSWECNNLLCPDRSIYNRGRRYQFRSVLYHSAMDDPRNEIPIGLISYLQRDVVQDQGLTTLTDALIRSYSMAGDVVCLIGIEKPNLEVMGRSIITEESPENSADDLSNLSFIRRIRIPSPGKLDVEMSKLPDSEVICGDSGLSLQALGGNIIGRAVTSPPYFNARDYSTWPNIYTYFSDMARIAQEVFRTLKPGGLYVYNIFDYFDNDRTIAFSDMGRRRINLASPTIAIFKTLGFELVGCDVWDKGDIQGNRGFNGGNRTPFYQSPFNCWEHVLIFRKPSDNSFTEDFGRVLRLSPVFKIIKGENTYGHTAPYPKELVDHYLEGLEPGEIVLDPFAGSGTTALSALEKGLLPLMLELHDDYANLIRSRIADKRVQLEAGLF